MATVYEKLGGEEGIDAAVELFYDKIMEDPYIVRFFDDVDMPMQITRQKAFLKVVCGGPHIWTGKDMREAHSHLVHERGLNDSHFDHVMVQLRSTLAEVGATRDVIDEVVNISESLRDEVLDR